MTGLVQFFAIPFGLGMIVIGAGLGIGKLAAAAAEGIARQPGAADKITAAVNLPLFLLQGVAILGEVTLLAKFAWGPLLKALDGRQAAIRKSLDDAQQATQDLARVQQQSDKIVRDARVEAEGIVARSRGDAERLREEIKQKARSEAEAIVKGAERQIQLETGRALQQIRREAADLSVLIASKIIQRNLSKEDNERLIDETIRQVESRQ